MQFIENLNNLIKEMPECADFDVVTSKDDEGNGFSPVHYEPQIGSYDKEDREFKEYKKPNAVCVN
jgi:hypothetical protein